jgi:DisA bacterial checkpoint controller nucleotide-binding
MPTLRNLGFFEELFCATFNGMSRYLGQLRIALVICSDGDPISMAFDPHRVLSVYGISKGQAIESMSIVLNEIALQQEQFLSVSKRVGTNRITWILQRTPALRNDIVIERWLSEATSQSKIGFDPQPIDPALRASATDTLLSFAASAVKRSLQERTKSYKTINPIEVVLNLSLAYEEGKKCGGNIAFYNGASPPLEAMCLCLASGSWPPITSTKHLRKLMTSVENSNFWVLTSNTHAVGLINGRSDPAQILSGSVQAFFNRGRADIHADGKYVCSVYEGQLFSRGAAPSELAIRQLVASGSFIQKSEVDNITAILSKLVEHAQGVGSGCSLVIDGAPKPRRLSGDYLDSPMDLHSSDSMTIALRMARIDGALHLRPDGTLLAFGCLLDGRSSTGEDRSRGARYNSAVRFTSDNHDTMVVTVSSDGPVSCFFGGRDLTRVETTVLTAASPIEIISGTR